MKTRKIMALVMVLAMIFVIAGCGGETPAQQTTAPAQSSAAVTSDASKDVPKEGLTFKNPIAKPDVITTKGPDGQPAVWYTELSLTPEELAKVRSMNLKAGFELINASEWDNANLIGFKEACDAMNIKVAAQAVCDLNPIKQKANMEQFQSMGLNIVSAQPQELDVAAATFDPLWKSGVKLTFMSNIPTGYTLGKEYSGAITDSLYDMGKDSAEMMADAIGGEGEIIAITVSGVNYVCNTRDKAFTDTIAQKYPKIKIVEVGGFQQASEAGLATSALITKHPNVKGIFVSYSNPAIDVLQTVKSLGRKDIKIITMDLDTTVALDMAQGGNVAGIAADMPYAMGYGRAILGAYGVLGKKVPGYITSPSFKITRANLAEGYKMSLGIEAPKEVQEALKK